MKNLPYNSKSTQIDEEFSKMVQRQIESNPEIHPIVKGMDDMLDVLRSCKPPKIKFKVDSSEIFWKDEEIRVEYKQEDVLDDMYDNDTDRITIQEFCDWMVKNKHNVITHEGHKHNGVFDQWTATYEPEDLLRDPIFDLNYHLELFLSDRGY